METAPLMPTLIWGVPCMRNTNPGAVSTSCLAARAFPRDSTAAGPGNRIAATSRRPLLRPAGSDVEQPR
jgi:hypothetical protein